MNGVKIAIRKTKKYADKYGQKLSDKQLFLRLISTKIYPFLSIKGKGINKSENGEWQNKIFRAEILTKQYLSKMKGILMVGVTGSVAAESALENEDIDLLIITCKDELWWWRLYVRFVVWWYKIPHRKYGKKEKMDEFCFNLWLDETNLVVPKAKRNLKNATDMIMMKVIWEKNGIYQKFLNKNMWVKKYLATGFKERVKMSRKVDKKISNKRKNNYLKKIVNEILFWQQYLYMRIKNKQKPKKNDVNMGQAFFHENS